MSTTKSASGSRTEIDKADVRRVYRALQALEGGGLVTIDELAVGTKMDERDIETIMGRLERSLSIQRRPEDTLAWNVSLDDGF